VFSGGLGKVCCDEGFGEGVVIDGGDGVSTVGEWIDVVHGVEGLWIDTGDGVVPEGEGVLLYVCDGGDGVSCEEMHSEITKMEKCSVIGLKDCVSMVVMKASVVYLTCSVEGIYGKIFYT